MWCALSRDGAALGWSVRFPRRELEYVKCGDDWLPLVTDGHYVEHPSGRVTATLRRRVDEFDGDVSVCVYITPGMARGYPTIRHHVFTQVTRELLDQLAERRGKDGGEC